MDISQLVKELVPFLAPFLPYLLRAGEKAAPPHRSQLWDTPSIRPRLTNGPFRGIL